MKNRKEIVVFDFETTGLSAFSDEIIEIGAMKLVNNGAGFEVSEELSLLLKTSVPISPKITEITGITPSMQDKYGVSQEEAFQKLSSMINEDTLLIAYNIQFDLGFLQNFYRRYWDPKFEVKNDLLDVMAVYKDRHKFPHRLESAVSQYTISFPNTHRALDDVKATYAVLEAMKDERDTISKYINVIGFNKKYGVSGPKLSHVKYVAQYGGYLEIEKM
ncbi:3'-5' exonuclease [Haploplasma axanthum]|uniref:DNA polymerase III polC-type n=1 Tax=Haploplasma axanthum TaxID=29552 RepID=A0A449BE23_HAPAX|nr:3'-5' exonuclease [Haploplasma axanthum]VEU80677.1 DNA polymerase III polC-type [Haploplasma axanthum]